MGYTLPGTIIEEIQNPASVNPKKQIIKLNTTVTINNEIKQVIMRVCAVLFCEGNGIACSNRKDEHT